MRNEAPSTAKSVERDEGIISLACAISDNPESGDGQENVRTESHVYRRVIVVDGSRKQGLPNLRARENLLLLFMVDCLDLALALKSDPCLSVFL